MSDTPAIRRVEGGFNAPTDAHVAIVAARFNDFIVEKLIDGAVDGLVRHGLPAANITVVRTPGAFELPLVARRLAKSGKFGAVIALGAVIRGSTPHFDYVCSSVSSGCASVMSETGLPVIFGVITTDTIEQAIERAGTKAGNKGFDAALSALEMINLGRALSAQGL
jgi:6,7-dimethyl-8-ribityllumazine synthase